MQFRATQKLLDPRKAHISLELAVKIFQSPSGAHRINWKKQILEAAGFPQYIECDNILGNIKILKSTTEKLKRNNLKSTWANILLEVGDPEEWEMQLKPQFGPNIEASKQLELLTAAYTEGQKREAEKDKEREKLLLELEESTKMIDHRSETIKIQEKRESSLLETIQKLQKQESQKEKEHETAAQKIEAIITKMG
uniref:Uncharacterized protein n=1 Tax=Panagrolaimus superbus TaxID=310955 RepID=A0A914Y5C3_9BILA